MDKQIEQVLNSLESNNIHAIFAERVSEIREIVKNILFEGCVISAGGSVSLDESGVWELINKPCYRFLDRNREGLTSEERQEVFRQCIGADFYFCSSNAVTKQGELINVDGFCNRIASIVFGPKKVIMVVGCNKIVNDVNEGFLRIKKIAAPKNCVRLEIDSPCAKLGHCVALEKTDSPDITDGCNTERRICTNYLVSGRQREKGRITVILCGEELGY